MRRAAGTTISRASIRFAAATMLTAAAVLSLTGETLALSELRPAAEPPKQARPLQDKPILEAFEGTTLPKPGPAIDRSAQAETTPAPAKPADPKAAPAPASPAAPAANAGKAAPENGAPLEIIRDLSKLPAPVKQMREQIVEAAASGDIERLRPLFGTGASAANVMNNEFEDPIDALKNFSGDAEGQEILAIMLDILSTGAAHFDAGTPDEAYVWPYFSGKALNTLTPPERVDLLRIVTAGDLAGMEENGNYNFFRLGISPDGKWKFFSGGD
jgi:hypothetical protein